jgi:hypothetical protein
MSTFRKAKEVRSESIESLHKRSDEFRKEIAQAIQKASDKGETKMRIHFDPVLKPYAAATARDLCDLGYLTDTNEYGYLFVSWS